MALKTQKVQGPIIADLQEFQVVPAYISLRSEIIAAQSLHVWAKFKVVTVKVKPPHVREYMCERSKACIMTDPEMQVS